MLGRVKPKSTCLHPSAELRTSIWSQAWTLMPVSRDWAPWFLWKKSNNASFSVCKHQYVKTCVLLLILYCYCTQLEIFSVYAPWATSLCSTHLKVKEISLQGWLQVEQLEATENYQEGPLIKPTELKTLTSFILPAPKIAFRATGKSWTPGFLAYATFSERG